jgi:hypothetical protein
MRVPFPPTFLPQKAPGYGKLSVGKCGICEKDRQNIDNTPRNTIPPRSKNFKLIKFALAQRILAIYLADKYKGPTNQHQYQQIETRCSGIFTDELGDGACGL